MFNIINELQMFFEQMEKWITEILNNFSEKLSDLIGALLYLTLGLPLFIIAGFFYYLLKYFSMHQLFVKNKKEFIKFMREKENE